MGTQQLSSLRVLLAQTRKRAELTQEALAERAGVSANTISNLEAGRGHLPRQATLDLLVRALADTLALDGTERTELRQVFRTALSADRSRQPSPPDAAETRVVASPPPLGSGVLTFLICGPARAAPEEPEDPRAAQQIRTWLATLLQQLAPRHGGRLVDPPEGRDGAVCAFPRTADAVLAACLLQQALWERPRALASAMADGAVGAVPVCLALHTGWAEPGSDDHYAGPTRRRAARLGRLGHGGQLLLTFDTWEVVQHSLPEGVRLQRLGQYSLSVVERPQPVAQLLPATLPRGFPPLRPLRLPPTNLPVQLTSFIGRLHEQTAVETLLEQAPLVTLVGAGGSGKTRLALAVAADLQEDYPGGVWLVELAALRDPALVPQAVATALALREEAGRPLLATLTDHLCDRRLLLVLDNCEHLLVACAELAAALLQRCPYLHLLATSRERLAISGESSYQLPSLALPAPDRHLTLAALDAYEGVRLFVERARANRPDFALREENADAVARICRRLDGMPLAIELAAARVIALPVETIAARLDDRFRLLTDGPRTALPRQQTLRATLDWSWALLTPAEQALLRRLAIFAGGWIPEAAESVCAGEAVARDDILDLLSALVNKSLVLLEETDGHPRYRLLETVRQYAREQLEAAGELVQTASQHLAWCLALAEESEPRLTGPEQGEWLVRLETEHDNLRAALAWAGERRLGELGLGLAAALWRFWYTRGYFAEGRGWLEAALAGSGPVAPLARAAALNGAGNLAERQWDLARAAALHEEALALRRELGDTQGIARSLGNLGNVAYMQGDYDRAAALVAESLALRRELGDKRGIANSLDNLGGVAYMQGDYDLAAILFEESLALRRELGDKWGIASSLDNLGMVTCMQGAYERATATLREALLLSRDIGTRDLIAEALEGMAWSVAALGQPEQAAQLAGAAETLREVLDVPLSPEQWAGHARAVQAMRAALGEESLAAWAAGRARPLEEAVALALAQGDPRRQMTRSQ